MNVKQCGSCEYYYHDEAYHLDGDHCCVNDKSEWCTCFVSATDTCDNWEGIVDESCK